MRTIKLYQARMKVSLGWLMTWVYGGTYVEYVSTRPGAARIAEHGDEPRKLKGTCFLYKISCFV